MGIRNTFFSKGAFMLLTWMLVLTGGILLCSKVVKATETPINNLDTTYCISEGGTYTFNGGSSDTTYTKGIIVDTSDAVTIKLGD